MSGREVFRAANAFGGLEPESVVNMTVAQIMEAADVKQSKAYDIHKKARQEVLSEGASDSLKDTLLQLITSQGTISDIHACHRLLSDIDHKASNYDITKALWGLQKSGDITFTERKSGRDSILTKIHLAKGTRFDPKFLGDRQKGRHPVGKDMTDEWNHGSRTTGGPVERIIPRPAPEVVPAPEYSVAEPMPPRYSGDTPLEQNQKLVIDDDSQAPMSAEAEHMDAPSLRKEGASDTHTQYPNRELDVDKYPAMARLFERVDREAKILAAAELLLDADPTMAGELLARIQDLTDLEKEVLEFFRERA